MATLANRKMSTEDIGMKLREELWRSQGKDGSDIFKLLKLDKEGNDLFASSAIGTWISYVERLHKVDKKSPDVMSQIDRRFGDMELARMIGFAKQQEPTKKFVTELQDLQFKQWLGVGFTPKDISDRIVLSKFFDTRNTRVMLDYHDFWKAKAASIG